MEKAITEQPKATYLNCLLKAFDLEDGTTTRNTRIAKKHLKNGEEKAMVSGKRALFRAYLVQ